MTTSAQYQLNSTTADAISRAHKLLQAAGQGEPLSGASYNDALEQLNLLLKQFETQGMHLWTQEEYFLFFSKGQASYDMRLPATRVVNAFDFSTLAADAAIAATSLTVADDSLMSIGQAIGIINDDLDLQWSVIEALPGGNVVNIRDALTVAASSGRVVRNYDTARLVTTTLAVGGVATDTDIQVASIVGIEPDYEIGITDDTGAVHWTTVNSVDADTDMVTLNDALTATSTLGNAVIVFSSEQNFKPLARMGEIDAVRRNAGELTDYEIPIVFQSREDYFNLPNKKQIGTPIQAHYSRQEPQGIWYLWNVPGSALEYLAFTGERQIQIQVSENDTFDIPDEWALALDYNLALLMIPIVGCSPQRVQLITAGAEKWLNEALSFDSEMYPIRLSPEQYG